MIKVLGWILFIDICVSVAVLLGVGAVALQQQGVFKDMNRWLKNVLFSVWYKMKGYVLGVLEKVGLIKKKEVLGFFCKEPRAINLGDPEIIFE